MRSIYFDYNATTPLDPAVRESMMPLFDEIYGNPSSVHHLGRKARSILDDCRYRVATLWKSKPSEVVFTSGGTESNNLAIFGTARLLGSRGRHIISSRLEHPAVLQCLEYLERHRGFNISWLPVGSEGIVDLDALQQSFRPDTILVSLMAANNETGAIQPIAEAGSICRDRGIVFHTDAVQWFGKEPFESIHQFNADLVSLCSHKFHGPKGAGALYIRSPLLPERLLFGGAHENERRAGTENLPSIVGFSDAFERFVPSPVFDRIALGRLSQSLSQAALSIEGVRFQGSLDRRLQNTISFTVSGCDSISLLAALDMIGICASSGSACSSGSLEPSHVLTAMGVPLAEANTLLRFSLGRASTQAEVDVVAEHLPGLISQIR